MAEVGDAFDALTGVLAEVASLATPTVLVLDDVENLPADAVERSLAYLVANAPANLTVVLGSRVELRQISLDAAMQAQSAVVGPEDMRFDLDETIALLRKRFGQRMELTDCARLHELTEGWPLGERTFAEPDTYTYTFSSSSGSTSTLWVWEPRHVCTFATFTGLSRLLMSKMRIPRRRSMLTVSWTP